MSDIVIKITMAKSQVKTPATLQACASALAQCSQGGFLFSQVSFSAKDEAC
jgi:hypothetical protein